jgi:transposase-like protein
MVFMVMWKCPKCGSDNVHSVYGGRGCPDCGLEFKVVELSTEDNLLKHTAQRTIITNVLGPIEVRVVQRVEHSRIAQEDSVSHFATLSLLPCLPKEIQVDSDLDLRVIVEG